MIKIETSIEEVRRQIDALQGNMEDAGDNAGALNAEMAKLRDNMLFTQNEVSGLSRSFGSDLKSAFDAVVFDGAKLSDTLRDVARSMAEAVYNSAMQPIQNTIGSAIAGGINRIVGGVVAGGGGAGAAGVQAFATGGVVGGPTYFPMRRGVGLMGEAGPEAIMPLTRGTDGRLGVRAQGAGSGRQVNVTVNVSTPDVEGFRRSQSQIAAQMNRALGIASRNR